MVELSGMLAHVRIKSPNETTDSQEKTACDTDITPTFPQVADNKAPAIKMVQKCDEELLCDASGI